jgi:hypothetical protein
MEFHTLSAQEQFGAKVEELIRQARALGPGVRKRVIELLEEARKRILAEVADVNPASFQSAQLVTLRKEIDAALETFRRELSQTVTATQANAFQLGAATVDQPLAAAGLPTPSFGGLLTSTLSIAQGYTADLIGGLTKDSAAKVNAAIQRAFLGGQSITEIIAQIGKAISGGTGFTGLFSPIGERAEAIALNEILRVHSIAAQARLEDLQEVHPELQKQWLHVPAARFPRPSHLLANKQVRKVDEPFDVGGEELMYPRDPNGSPENTINCHCLMRPYFDASALKPTPAHQKLLNDLGIQISIAPLDAGQGGS